MSRMMYMTCLLSVALLACGSSPIDGPDDPLAVDSSPKIDPTTEDGAAPSEASVPAPDAGTDSTPPVDGGSDTGPTCPQGKADCNANGSDGCEVSLTDDPKNCGACGNACSAFETCSSGSCAAKSCPANMADCNRTNTDGCEVSLKNDPINCGACGTTCSANGGTPSCSSGACQIACAPSFENCNGQVTDGCEINTQTDKMNCGACGTVCPGINGTASCLAGSCQIACDANHADVDGNLANGCEIDLRIDPNNCGSVGVVCTNPTGAVGSCVNKVCRATCSAGYGNCDGNPLNGCEKLDTMANCGACGTACNAGTQTCQAGACSSVMCAAGTGNCDGNAANGCETATNTVLNCGGCGVRCTAPAHMTAACDGACQFTCQAGWADCNGNLADGCEVNVKADANNCGACGTTCSQNGGAGTCSNGSCQIACMAGTTANCNGQVSDGCEVSLKNDVSNCGSCGNACPSKPHASPTCSATGCGTTCQTNWGDCDGNAANGCERSLANDDNNCGACGKSCHGGTCSNGTCSYDVNQLYTEVGVGIVQVATDDTNVYWTTSAGGAGKVAKVAKTGGPITVLATGFSPQGITVQGGFVYWTDLGNVTVPGGPLNKIQRTPVGGGATTTISENIDQPFHIVADDTNVYWLSSERSPCNCTTTMSTKLFKAPITGVNVAGTQVNTTTIFGEAGGLAGNSHSLYIIRRGAYDPGTFTYPRGGIARVLKTTGVVSTVATDQHYPTALSVNSDFAFWTGDDFPQSGRRMQRGRFSDLTVSSLTADIGTVDDSATDANLVVWLGSTVIRKIHTDGSGADLVAENQNTLRAIALDTTHVYWAGANGSTWYIRKAPR